MAVSISTTPSIAGAHGPRERPGSVAIAPSLTGGTGPAVPMAVATSSTPTTAREAFGPRHPDDAILADCRSLTALHGQFEEVWRDWGHNQKEHPQQIASQARVDAYHAEIDRLLGRLAEATPITTAAKRARAKAVILSITEIDRFCELMSDANNDALIAVLNEAAGETVA